MKISLRSINNWLFFISILSIDFPVKVYPIIFVIASISFLYEAKTVKIGTWSLFLIFYSLYAIVMFLVSGNFDELRLINFYKIFINFFFLFASICWLGSKKLTNTIQFVDIALHITFFLIFAQLMLYHKDAGFQYITGIKSSNEGNTIYKTSLFFWGLDNKNLFGARIATLGFPYILIPAVKSNKISFFRIAVVVGLAFLSMSRTPLFAVLLGLIYIILNKKGVYIKAMLITGMIMALPYFLQKVLRVNDIVGGDDGMAIRLIYWGAFFNHFDKISIFGEGFLAADKFLSRYSPFYAGEPNIHNTFLNNYLDFGVFGLLFYVGFLYYLYKYFNIVYTNKKYWIAAFIPILSTMMLLYPGYDNDIIVYLVLIFLIGCYENFDFKQLNYSII